jgi:hypothetical protein
MTLGIALASSGVAAPIATLFNTGVDASGALLPAGNGQVDTHYTIISGPGISSPISAVTYFNGAYAADGPSSRWISASASGGNGAGTYVFQTMFNLTGFNPSTATITVRCGTDNSLTGATLNGTAITGADCDGFNPFPAATFTISSGFAAGVNTLQFSVVDAGPPMAFRAEYTSDVQPISGGAIPEPATFGLLASGVAVLALLRRRRS